MFKRSSRKKKEKSRKTPGWIVSHVLIGVGLLLMLSAAGYEMANYPWRSLCWSQEDLNNLDLPDPAPPHYNEDAETYVPNSDEDAIADESLLSIFDGPDPSIIHELLGYLKIPRLNLSVNIFEGASQTQLLLGAGHVIGTPMPGTPGNVCISGHRVTARMHPLRHMDKMRKGDFVFVVYEGHVFKYETTEVFPVYSAENWVLRQPDEEMHMLTLITCHPPGSARQRLILRGSLIEVDGQPVDENQFP